MPYKHDMHKFNVARKMARGGGGARWAGRDRQTGRGKEREGGRELSRTFALVPFTPVQRQALSVPQTYAVKLTG